MDHLLLDVVDVVPARSGNGLDYSFYLMLALTILAEAGVLTLLRYQAFGKSLFSSLVVNLVSLAAGFILIEFFPGLFSATKLLNLGALFLITVAVELPVLQLLNRQQPFRQTAVAALVMNAASYLLFYLYVQIFAR